MHRRSTSLTDGYSGISTHLLSRGGTLSDPGGLISNSIDANLGGVFTGVHAEAFVGSFDLVDQLDQFNHVNGIYTIEK